MAAGVIFDMDGVMVLTESAHWEAWRATAATRGIALTHATFLSCFGRVNDDCVRVMFGESTPRTEMDAIAVEKEAAFRRIIEREVPLAPGLIKLMDALKAAGVKLAVGSSAPPENVQLVIEQGRLGDYFDVCIDGSQVKRGKPAPDVFLAAAKGLGLAPSACAVIEDAPPGIQAAVAAGTRAIGVATTHSRAQLLDVGAEIVFDSIAAIPPSFLIA